MVGFLRVHAEEEVNDDVPAETDDRTEPDVSVYADALLLIDALERHDPTSMDTLDTETLIAVSYTHMTLPTIYSV